MFSEKYGYKPEKVIQHENISDELRNRIWNLFYQNEIKVGGLSSKRLSQAVAGAQTIEEKISDKLGFLIDSSSKSPSVMDRLKSYILSSSSWFEVYDFVEIHLSVLEKDNCTQRIQQYNEIFAEEKSGYRIVAGEIAPITNKSEIQSIEQATSTPYQSVNQHIQKSLAFYSNIKTPDYENSVKESISAVEAMCCIITGKDATLNKAIEKLKNNGVHIHPALEKAFISLYAYTCDEKGIRHAGIEFVNAPSEDAKYMLISCSAFVNYLMEKWSNVRGADSKALKEVFE